MEERVCQKCSLPFSVSAYEVKRGGGKFCSRLCQRSFQAAVNADKMKTPSGWRDNRRARRKSEGRSEKLRAREAVQRAVRAGRLERKPCSVCGKSKSEAHHSDYTRPLEVEWLCRRHHFLEHEGSERGGFVAL